MKALVVSRDATLEERKLKRTGAVLLDDRAQAIYVTPTVIRRGMVLLSDEQLPPVRMPWQSPDEVRITQGLLNRVIADRSRAVRLGDHSLGSATLHWLRVITVGVVVLGLLLAFLVVVVGMPQLLDLLER